MKGRRRQSRVMDIQNNGGLCMPDKCVSSTVNALVQVVITIDSVLGSSCDDLESGLVNRYTCCRIWYGGNHLTSKCRHLQDHTYIVKACDRNNEARLGTEGGHQRQIQPHTLHYFLRSPEWPGLLEVTWNMAYQDVIKWRIMDYGNESY